MVIYRAGGVSEGQLSYIASAERDAYLVRICGLTQLENTIMIVVSGRLRLTRIGLQTDARDHRRIEGAQRAILSEGEQGFIHALFDHVIESSYICTG